MYANWPCLSTVSAANSSKTPEAATGEEIPIQSPNLAVKVSASFPASEIFGVKLVNGKTTEALVSFHNEEITPVNVAFIGGALWTTNSAVTEGYQGIVRNLTTTRYNVQIPAGESESISYKFTTELHPQDLRLNLVAMIQAENNIYQVSAFNETVSVVEPDASFFDPQLYVPPVIVLRENC